MLLMIKSSVEVRSSSNKTCIRMRLIIPSCLLTTLHMHKAHGAEVVRMRGFNDILEGSRVISVDGVTNVFCSKFGKFLDSELYFPQLWFARKGGLEKASSMCFP